MTCSAKPARRKDNVPGDDSDGVKSVGVRADRRCGRGSTSSSSAEYSPGRENRARSVWDRLVAVIAAEHARCQWMDARIGVRRTCEAKKGHARVLQYTSLGRSFGREGDSDCYG